MRCLLALLSVGVAACTTLPTTGPRADAPGANQLSTTAPPSRTAVDDDLAHETPSGLVAATVPLDSQRRFALGLPDPGTDLVPGSLAPLTPEQWADPEIVAARFLLVETNYAATEDPQAVAARRALYASPGLGRQLELAGGEALPSELRETETVFHGQVVGLVNGERTRTTASVGASVRQWRTSSAGVSPARISFYVLRLVLDRPSQRWLVVEVQIS